ncbi:Bifunctional protein TrpGD [Vibrio aerogenes CECT 7868]|uniref:Bifunctional protein TrpGD n=1 Tax=Vibrio aerogenes CECT 7868 TaxID=1216006 RepID=A0A1M5Y084_9VIBR|nr:glycosyl transferase family protein [Vibrio aerogenes]SHI05471.1 Bifunctional protein TrpGD [Vibrio aerogenes CECT 7868]
MSATFSEIIQLIGKGKKAGQYLTREQARQAMSQVLNGEVTPEQTGAFLMLLRVREESSEELAGFLAACREHVIPEFDSISHVDLDLGCYAGKRRHLPWLVLAVMALAQQGYKIFLHGTQEPQSQRLYLSEVWQAFGWSVATSVSQANQQLAERGFCYMDLHHIHPALYDLIQLRRLFGLRSCANTLSRMLNPAGAPYSLHGVFHREFDARHAEVAQLTGDSGVACFRGDGGEVEVNPERGFELYSCFDGQLVTDEFPALLSRTQVKPRALEPQEMRPVWRGEAENQYGEAAVTGTIAVMLRLTEQLSVPESLRKAQQVWENRIRDWPQLD